MIQEKVLEKLEYHKIRNMLADLALFEGGAARAQAMIPIDNFDSVNKRLDETGEAMEALRFGEPSFLSGLKLLNRELAKVRVGGILTAAELRDVYLLLYASRMAVRYVQGGKYPFLTSLCSSLTEDRELEQKIDRAVAEDGQLRDDASPELKQIRNQINTFRIRIKDYLQNFIRSTDNQKILQEALVTERDGRYVVPVKQENRSMVKGIVHDESASGATVYIEPLPVVDLNNRMRSMQMEEKREIERILRSFSVSIGFMVKELERNQEVLALLDFVFARARLAYKMNAYRPVTNMRGVLEIYRGKHPLLGQDAVPVDVELGMKFDVLVITGPNTGGKTVTLKTIGLLVLMTMSGLYIPAREKSRISIFNSIYVDIGDEQSIEQSLSTFSSHMSNIIRILDGADRRSLVLLDELGAGTDPVEGSALGHVILDELRAKGAKVIVTTHQSELKNYAYQTDRVENACVEFDPVSLRPTYELTTGMPGQSNAFEIATKLGMKNDLVQKARGLVPQKEMEVGNMIRQLKESHYTLDKESREVIKIKEELIKDRERLQNAKQDFEQERQEIIGRAREEAAQELRRVKQEAGKALQEFKDLIKDKDKPPKWHEIEEKRQKIKNIVVNKYADEVEPDQQDQKIRTGDYVLIKNINQKGYVLGIHGSQGDVSIQVGSMKFNARPESLVKLDIPAPVGTPWRGESFLDKARNISKEIDVRGQLAEDAIMEIDKYLADALLVGIDTVRLIHGKGTGALRTAVQKYLKTHPQVKAFRDGLPEEGGQGVTVVEFK
ncbi:recombination inhibitory protein mutS2 [hydrocarbon metagenome]|uniref:Recombination inhibitory protein mutS2 n=1 Tax=hydrocarbon metagenome TaxID=938273 RepID=A0A0W8E6H2_9ZZZZ